MYELFVLKSNMGIYGNETKYILSKIGNLADCYDMIIAIRNDYHYKLTDISGNILINS